LSPAHIIHVPHALISTATGRVRVPGPIQRQVAGLRARVP
jgi:hypothetical protein